MGVESVFQAALFTRLDAIAGFTGVYDRAPQADDGNVATVFPYLTFGTMIFSALDVKPKVGVNVAFRLHTHGRVSQLQIRTLQGAVYTALHRNELTLTGFNNFSLLREDSDCFSEPDGKFHGVCEYRALIESA